MMRYPLAVGTLLAFLVVLSGCASTEPAKPALLQNPRAAPIFRGDGTAASWTELVSGAAGADAVLLGENHGHEIGLAAAAALWSDVLVQRPKGALSMEFFERDEQSRLDDYLTGVTDEATFKKRTNRSDSNYPPGHRSMVEAAKTAGRPVIAANAPRPYVRVARTEGFKKLESLTPEQRRQFRIPDEVPGGHYREAFDKVMGDMSGHGAPPAKTPEDPAAAAAKKKADLDGAFRSQSLWDWTMADSIATALSAEEAPVVHVVGRFHCEFDGGLVQALRRLRSGVKPVVVVFVDESPAGFRSEDLGRADFVVYVGPGGAE